MYWYEEEVQRVEKEMAKLDYSPGMVFYGSSSIRMWDSLYEDFRLYKPVNLGFGGSTLEACVHFFQRILKPYHPQQLVVYAGDNDLGDGKNPDEVFTYFKKLCKLTIAVFKNTPVFYISIKPSIARWEINDQIKETNTLIENAIRNRYHQVKFIDIYSSMINEDGTPRQELYLEDGLHLSPQGYALWKQVLLAHFAMNIDSNIILQH
jgi:lysophospholipase L1-like esterase